MIVTVYVLVCSGAIVLIPSVTVYCSWGWSWRKHSRRVEMAVCDWVWMQEPSVFCDGIFKHVPRWNKCVIVLGDYCGKEWYLTEMNELHLVLKLFLGCFVQPAERYVLNILGTYGRGDVERGKWEPRKGEGRAAVRASCSDETELWETAVSLENQVTGMKWWNINVSYNPVNHICTFSTMKKWKCV